MPNEESKIDKLVILVENVRTEVQRVAEAHELLGTKIDTVRSELKNDNNDVRNQIQFVAKKVDSVRSELKNDNNDVRNQIQFVAKKIDSVAQDIGKKIDTVIDKVDQHDEDIRLIKDHAGLSV